MSPTSSSRISGRNDFHYDASLGDGGGYIFKLRTKGLTSGTWLWSFTVTRDPISHAVQFDVK